jgi:hypothetical protein
MKTLRSSIFKVALKSNICHIKGGHDRSNLLVNTTLTIKDQSSYVKEG